MIIFFVCEHFSLLFVIAFRVESIVKIGSVGSQRGWKHFLSPKNNNCSKGKIFREEVVLSMERIKFDRSHNNMISEIILLLIKFEVLY